LEIWADICDRAGLATRNFEAMLIYQDDLTEDLLGAVCQTLSRTRNDLLEDMGTYLVTRPRHDAVRRLLRFGGDTFREFLFSLDDLHDRAQLALPDFDFPFFEVSEHAHDYYSLTFRWAHPGFGAVALGVLRAMADEYGALVVMEHCAVHVGPDGYDRISIRILDTDFALGRHFDLGAAMRDEV